MPWEEENQANLFDVYPQGKIQLSWQEKNTSNFIKFIKIHPNLLKIVQTSEKTSPHKKLFSFYGKRTPKFTAKTSTH